MKRSDMTMRFPRTCSEAFGLSAEDANPFQSYRRPLRMRLWFKVLCVLAVLLVLYAAGVFLHANVAYADPAPVLTKRDIGAQRACPPGHTAVWTSPAEMECFKEKL